MAKKKKSGWKKTLKKVGKAAAIAAALYGATKLGKRGVTGVVKPGTNPGDAFAKARKAMTSDAAYGNAPYVDAIRRIKPQAPGSDWRVGPPSLAAKGGRIGKKHGGRTRKQFGGGLNRPVARPVGGTARRDMRSGYYPSDMGMRGGTMYKKGGRVKSMGIAKRGGGAAKR